MSVTAGFVPPPYPYDRLDAAKAVASRHPGGVVDLSVGTPCDPPADAVIAALAGSNTERGYPASIGSDALRTAASAWIGRRFGVDIKPGQLAACIGTKEFVATTPQYLKLRRPDRDVVLYPAIAYPTYEMGAIFAGCRPVPVPLDPDGRMRLESITPGDASSALCLWVNSPSNPTGLLDNLGAAAQWGRDRGVPVLSDECYCEFTWDGAPRTILEHGTDGVLAVHSLSKRSNLAGVRVGFYAGDDDLVEYLREVRKHAGFMVPGPAQAAGVVALGDDQSVSQQRDRYRRRLERVSAMINRWSGVELAMPAGGFYLWGSVGDGWQFANRLAADGGALVSPGEFYGPESRSFIRIAVVQPDTALDLVEARLAKSQ